jgi:hypothetical protein
MHGRAVCTAASKKPTDLYFLKVAFEALFLYMYDVLIFRDQNARLEASIL